MTEPALAVFPKSKYAQADTTENQLNAGNANEDVPVHAPPVPKAQERTAQGRVVTLRLSTLGAAPLEGGHTGPVSRPFALPGVVQCGSGTAVSRAFHRPS
jgi:hypothetical protein